MDIQATGKIICLSLIQAVQLTTAATHASQAQVRVPADGTIVAVEPIAGIIGGTTEFTDIDGMVENGTTDLFAANHALVDSSAIVMSSAPSVETEAKKRVAAGDVLHLDLVTTGGSSPEADGFGFNVFIALD